MLLEQKQWQRQQGIAARKALSSQERERKSARICQRIQEMESFQRAKTILLYEAFGGEANLGPLKAAAEGKRLAYPVCLPGWTLAAACPRGEDGWEIGTYGIRTPVLERSEVIPPEELDLVLTPCTAFDQECRRVGMGKGYYDRYLVQCVHAVKLGVAFECQRVERAATEAHDLRLDGFLTEKEVYTWKR